MPLISESMNTTGRCHKNNTIHRSRKRLRVSTTMIITKFMATALFPPMSRHLVRNIISECTKIKMNATSRRLTLEQCRPETAQLDIASATRSRSRSGGEHLQTKLSRKRPSKRQAAAREQKKTATSKSVTSFPRFQTAQVLRNKMTVMALIISAPTPSNYRAHILRRRSQLQGALLNASARYPTSSAQAQDHTDT